LKKGQHKITVGFLCKKFANTEELNLNFASKKFVNTEKLYPNFPSKKFADTEKLHLNFSGKKFADTEKLYRILQSKNLQIQRNYRVFQNKCHMKRQKFSHDPSSFFEFFLPWRPSENFVFSCGNYFCPLFCI
jgi:hypothetical protein